MIIISREIFLLQTQSTPCQPQHIPFTSYRRIGICGTHIGTGLSHDLTDRFLQGIRPLHNSYLTGRCHLRMLCYCRCDRSFAILYCCDNSFFAYLCNRSITALPGNIVIFRNGFRYWNYFKGMFLATVDLYGAAVKRDSLQTCRKICHDQVR